MSDKPHVLILDDEPARDLGFVRRFPECQRTYARDAQEACDALERGAFDTVSLDHDLGEGVGATGMDVARYIVAMAPERWSTSTR